MFIEKWNYEKQLYEPYNIPAEWKPRVCCSNVNEIINCASCGKKIAYRDSYTSRVIHNSIGFGYAVCYKCHADEVTEELEKME